MGMLDTNRVVDDYMLQRDWRVKENSNAPFSFGQMNKYIISAVSKQYWAERVYNDQAEAAHNDGFLHIHDMSGLTIYCCGYSLQKVLDYGVKGIPNIPASKPAKHFDAALNTATGSERARLLKQQDKMTEQPKIKEPAEDELLRGNLMGRQLLVNKIKTPDGTILESRHRHDYREYVDCLSGETYIVDGGYDYLRRSGNTVPYEEMSLYDDDDFEKIREHFTWGTYGESGKEKLQYVALKNLDTQHIHNIIWHIEMRGFSSHVLLLMIKELEYRGEE